jgi:ribosomal protein L5
MLVTPKNREFQGITVKVFDPETNRELGSDEVIDLDTISFDKSQHYQRVLRDGDLIEAKIKTSKTNKE